MSSQQGININETTSIDRSNASYFFAGCNEGWPVAATESSNSTSCGTESTKSLTN